MTQRKQWCFTLHEPFDFDDVAQRLRETSLYAIIGEETCPTTGRRHIQGYVCFTTRRRFNGVREVLTDRAHIEPASGNPKQNYEYCSKGGHFLVIGKFPTGTRPDLELVCDHIRNGTPLSTIVMEHTSTFVRYSRGIQRALDILADGTQRTRKNCFRILKQNQGSRYINSTLSRWNF